jgi:hypothetical protein
MRQGKTYWDGQFRFDTDTQTFQTGARHKRIIFLNTFHHALILRYSEILTPLFPLENLIVCFYIFYKHIFIKFVFIYLLKLHQTNTLSLPLQYVKI